eukprot:TRINITY_DN1436_c0_g1_i10.p1 TRINITY_DN1436_c0_g1~~TRINITY_DN1436_c0_g1_i10.p1  ORF type:complete len:325 (+),score=65.97 TRINITY_DN1436_c0_g1_i10:80-1054(+)
MVSLIFGGCLDFGRKLTVDKSHATIDYLLSRGIKSLDTASCYSDGKSEVFMGLHPACNDPERTIITTKANAFDGQRLTPASINTQLTTSLANLKRPYADLFYLHTPDHLTPIEESLSEVHKLYKAGLFKEFGLSNYKSWEVIDIYHICQANGWVLPSVYQGMYNPVTRSVEAELFPALRKFGMRFDAYNPLAGGILTGKHKFSDKSDGKIQPGRFEGNSWAATYQKRFWSDSMFNTVDMVQKALDKAYGANHGVSLVETTLRWMLHHSSLSGKHGDGLILGASSLEQTKENVEACEKGPLDPLVVAAFEEGWTLIKGICPDYFR